MRRLHTVTHKIGDTNILPPQLIYTQRCNSAWIGSTVLLLHAYGCNQAAQCMDPNFPFFLLAGSSPGSKNSTLLVLPKAGEKAELPWMSWN